jgi:hypothetical protein
MPRTKVIAIKDMSPFFKIGDKLTIVPILYKEDTLLVNEIYGLFKDNNLIKFFKKTDLSLKDIDTFEIKLLYDKVIASKGTYKDCYIKLENDTQYPSSLVRDFKKYFKKI